ncbi:hypothetical protein RLIN73S_06487 [Rhodanobacter lindaniclasticus]
MLVHRYGPHIFHTNGERIFQYLSRFTEWLLYDTVRGWWVARRIRSRSTAIR